MEASLRQISHHPPLPPPTHPPWLPIALSLHSPPQTDSHCQLDGRLRRERHSGDTAPSCMGCWTHLLLARLLLNPAPPPHSLPSLPRAHLLSLGLQLYCPLSHSLCPLFKCLLCTYCVLHTLPRATHLAPYSSSQPHGKGQWAQTHLTVRTQTCEQ